MSPLFGDAEVAAKETQITTLPVVLLNERLSVRDLGLSEADASDDLIKVGVIPGHSRTV